MNLTRPLSKGERTRTQIVIAAANLFWRRSYHAVSVDHVAASAGVNKATVYRYFADKGDLSLAVVRYHGELALRDVFEGNFQKHARPDLRLAAIYHDLLCAHHQIKQDNDDLFGCPIVGLALELGQELPALRDEANAIFGRIEDYLRTIATDALRLQNAAGSPDMLARTLTQLLHGGFASARIATEPDRMLDAGRASLALIGFPHTSIIDNPDLERERAA